MTIFAVLFLVGIALLASTLMFLSVQKRRQIEEFQSLLGEQLLGCQIEGQVFQRIEGLSIVFTHMPSDVETSAIRSQDRLLWLDLYGPSVDDDALLHILDGSSVESLWLLETSVTHQGISKLVNAKSLKSLSLSGMNVGQDELTALAKLKALDSIGLVNCEISDADFDALIGSLPTTTIHGVRTR